MAASSMARAMRLGCIHETLEDRRPVFRSEVEDLRRQESSLREQGQNVRRAGGHCHLGVEVRLLGAAE